MAPVATTSIPVAAAASTEVATPIRAAATERATPVRPDNPIKELSSQVSFGTKTVSRRAHTRKSNAGLPWLMALGALIGVGLLIAVIMFLLNQNGEVPK